MDDYNSDVDDGGEGMQDARALPEQGQTRRAVRFPMLYAMI